jgi:hypothetical protein
MVKRVFEAWEELRDVSCWLGGFFRWASVFGLTRLEISRSRFSVPEVSARRHGCLVIHRCSAAQFSIRFLLLDFTVLYVRE